MPRELSAGRYGFREVEAGDWFWAGTEIIAADMIDRFADLTGDRFEIHMSDEAARAHGFKARVAHGLLILSLIDGLKNQAEVQFDAMASLGWEWRFALPVLIGDAIAVKIEVLGTRATSKVVVPPDRPRGVITLNFTITNQTGVTVQQGTNQLLAYE